MDGTLEQHAPLPPPSASAAVPAPPTVPAAGQNMKPHVAGAVPSTTLYVPPPRRTARPSRTRVYTIGALAFVVISVAGYIGFRTYIYGDDAPPVPVLDDLGG